MTAPLSESQLRFWRGQQLQPDVPLYNMAWRFDLHMDLDPVVFGRALQAVIAGSDILRAEFVVVDGIPEQRMAAVPADPMPNPIDLSDHADPEAALEAQMRDWVRAPFDLTQSAIRNRLVKLSKGHWVWVLCQHHIACDAQSGAVLFEAVSQAYGVALNEPQHEPMPQRPYFDSAPCTVEAAAVDHGTTPARPTPPYTSDSRRDATSTRVFVPLAEPQFANIETAISSPELRLFTPDLSRLAFYLTTYLAYLHRVTGDDRIVLGLPSHNRLSAADRATLGLFVEVLPFAIDLSSEDSFLDLHSKVKNGLGTFLRTAKPGALAAADTRDIGAVLNFIQARFGTFAAAPATVRWIHPGAHDAEHALRLHVMDFGGNARPELALDISNAVLARTTPAEIITHITAMLDAMLADPTTPIGHVPLCADAGRGALLTGPAEAPSAARSVLDLIAVHATETPGATAMRMGDQQISYRDMQTRSDGIAAHLQGLGIARGACVAVQMRRSIDCVLALLGILKAGCAFVPISAQTPYGRSAQILTGSEAAAIFIDADNTQSYVCPSLHPADCTGAGVTCADVAADDRAYVLFTSGSTGTPKGVEVSHGAFLRYITWAADTFGTGGTADYAFFSSLSFDLTLTSLFVPLTSGAASVVYPDAVQPDLAVLDVFREDAVDVVKLTPSHLALLCKDPTPVSRIKTLVLGGETLTTALCRMAQHALGPHLRIINEYGPTEAVVGAMEHVFDPARDLEASVPIGLPARGVTLSVRDAGFNLCPPSVPGEIMIGGRLALGYAGQPDMTDERFLQDQKGLQGRLYRTGDLGNLRPDGVLDYMGRADQQLKIGGVRIETAEIESAVRQVPGVASVHVGFWPRNAPHAADEQACTRCGLPASAPDAQFLASGLCTLCAAFDTYKDRAEAYFRPEPELQQRLENAAANSTGDYDAVMLLSGGKDSTYAAYRLGAYTSRVLAVTLDNGYISEGAKTNVARVVEHLGWDHRYLSTDRMNEIFVDSLKTHSNVCQGCFKAIYTLALRTARAEGAAAIVTGLSRGQFFETRLTPDLFRTGTPTCAELENMVQQARKTYHAEDDAIARLLHTDDLRDGRVLDEVDIIDIYRFIDVPVSEIYEFLDAHTAWARPADTGRSTNCLINDVGIHVHKQREGYHNYALPYSWDVRMGHKTRAQAMAELDDEIDLDRVLDILDEIGFDEPVSTPPALVVYATGAGVTQADIRAAMAAHLPREVLPKHVVILDDMPLTANGKVDTARLPAPRQDTATLGNFEAPQTEMEHQLASIACDVLGIEKISVTADFFDLGVESLAAIQIAMKANEAGLPLPATAVFEHRTLRSLAAFAAGLETETQDHDDADDDLLDLGEDDLSSIAQALN